jgi:hypothetical protein
MICIYTTTMTNYRCCWSISVTYLPSIHCLPSFTRTGFQFDLNMSIYLRVCTSSLFHFAVDYNFRFVYLFVFPIVRVTPQTTIYHHELTVFKPSISNLVANIYFHLNTKLLRELSRTHFSIDRQFSKRRSVPRKKCNTQLQASWGWI